VDGVTTTYEPGTSRYADLDGELHYTDHGGPAGAPLLVCVHGLGGSSVNWIAVAPLLTDAFRVLAPDLAGHGRTLAGTRTTDVNANQRLLDRFLREVSGTPAILIGNSMGGLISLLQAGRNPETVAGLVLVDPALPREQRKLPDREVAARFALAALPMVGERYMAKQRRQRTPERLVAETLALCCVDPSRVPAPVVAALVDLARERLINRAMRGRDISGGSSGERPSPSEVSVGTRTATTTPWEASRSTLCSSAVTMPSPAAPATRRTGALDMPSIRARWKTVMTATWSSGTKSSIGL